MIYKTFYCIYRNRNNALWEHAVMKVAMHDFLIWISVCPDKQPRTCMFFTYQYGFGIYRIEPYKARRPEFKFDNTNGTDVSQYVNILQLFRGHHLKTLVEKARWSNKTQFSAYSIFVVNNFKITMSLVEGASIR